MKKFVMVLVALVSMAATAHENEKYRTEEFCDGKSNESNNFDVRGTCRMVTFRVRAPSAPQAQPACSFYTSDTRKLGYNFETGLYGCLPINGKVPAWLSRLNEEFIKAGHLPPTAEEMGLTCRHPDYRGRCPNTLGW